MTIEIAGPICFLVKALLLILKIVSCRGKTSSEPSVGDIIMIRLIKIDSTCPQFHKEGKVESIKANMRARAKSIFEVLALRNFLLRKDGKVADTVPISNLLLDTQSRTSFSKTYESKRTERRSSPSMFTTR